MPMKQKYYRYDKQKTEIIEWQVRKILKKGIIKRTNSLYCSLVVLCRKTEWEGNRFARRMSNSNTV